MREPGYSAALRVLRDAAGGDLQQVIAAAILAGLSQRSWRDFGAADPSAAASPQRLPHRRRPGAASATTDIAESTS